ncbi:hypothetical protein BAUCODRAFT_197186 [Baudoinia panamericana UAMH 10762]|uniref:Uncharacterized protein n=1 Tax=Baudoinia panamericana (strain UAMH 10762) TaxID=717646 RepID=M2MVW9_BAUPA|nr:uncharacterized protein BAUCODRAFT_197186 [Baudoinia panamericana UAMH 10762]EMD01127.1 hypothetical protein BAUCODRAFT_197186 [Baudoinia panamericana UAMH 10762]
MSGCARSLRTLSEPHDHIAAYGDSLLPHSGLFASACIGESEMVYWFQSVSSRTPYKHYKDDRVVLRREVQLPHSRRQ